MSEDLPTLGTPITMMQYSAFCRGRKKDRGSGTAAPARPPTRRTPWGPRPPYGQACGRARTGLGPRPTVGRVQLCLAGEPQAP